MTFRHASRIHLNSTVYETIVAAANRAAPDRETGGVLFGVRAGRDVCVIDVAEVPPARASRTWFETTEAARNQAIERFLKRECHDSPIGYVGTWHSHLGGVGASGVDLATLRMEALDAPDLIAMVVAVQRNGVRQLDGYIGHHRRVIDWHQRRRVRVPWTARVVVNIQPRAADHTSPGNGKPVGRGRSGTT